MLCTVAFKCTVRYSSSKVTQTAADGFGRKLRNWIR